MTSCLPLNYLMETLLVSTKKISYRDFVPLFNGPVKVSLTKQAEKNIENPIKTCMHFLMEIQPCMESTRALETQAIYH